MLSGVCKLTCVPKMVDAGSDAEAMVERLTEENLALAQANGDLRTATRDLEEAAEIMEELDASQRSEIAALRREVEDREAEVSNARTVIEKLQCRLDEVGRGAERLQQQYVQSKSKCALLQEEIDAHLEKSLSVAERQREARYKTAQRDLLWYSERCETLALSVARLQADLHTAEAERTRALSLLPTAEGGGGTGDLSVAVADELKHASAEIGVARALGVLLSAQAQVGGGCDVLDAAPDVEGPLPVLYKTAMKVVTPGNFCPSYFALTQSKFVQVLLTLIGETLLAGVALCWKSRVVLKHGVSSDRGDRDAAKALQWEDGVLALCAALGCLEDAAMKQLLPCVISATERSQLGRLADGSFGGDATAARDAVSALSKMHSAHSVVRAALGKCQDRLQSCSSALGSADGALAEMEAVDLSLGLKRVDVLTAGLSAAGSVVAGGGVEVEANSTDCPPTAEWFSSAILNLLNRSNFFRFPSPLSFI